MARPGLTSARLLIGLLLLATVLVDAVAVSIVLLVEDPIDHPRRFFWIFVLGALVLAQSSLVAIWAGLGRKSIAWRAMALVLTVTAGSGLVGWLYEPSKPSQLATEWTLLLLAQTILIFVCVMTARLAGVRALQANEALSPGNDAHRRRRFQFSLAYAFSWIIAVGVILGILQYTIHREHIRPDADFWLSVAMLSIAHAAMALAALWAALGTRWVALRIALLCVTTLTAHAAHQYVWEDVLFGVPLYLVQLFWLVASLWVIRVAGYRLVRRASRLR